MEFHDNAPIFLQIADRLADEILSGTYTADNRVPGVREYSCTLGVNPNTTVKAFEVLARQHILYVKRGMGYFVCPDAIKVIREERLKTFFSTELPGIFRRMALLGISLADLEEPWRRFTAEQQTER